MGLGEFRMRKHVLLVDKNKPIELEIINILDDDKTIVRGRLNTYHLDYDVETSSVLLGFTLEDDRETIYSIRLQEDDSLLKCLDCTPQEVFFNIVNFLGEVIHKAKSVGYTLVMKLDYQASRLLVKDLTKIGEEYRVFNGELVY